jgi:hypothetical protein
MARIIHVGKTSPAPKTSSRKKRLSKGQIRLLRSQGHGSLTDRKVQEMVRAHDRFVKAANLIPAMANSSISLEEAERRVERYLETLPA